MRERTIEKTLAAGFRVTARVLKADHLSPALALVPVLVSAIMYWPILTNYFHADDFGCMYNIANNGFVEFLLTPNGGHLLFVRNLIFYAFYRMFGLDPLPYFVSVLLTHLANVLLLFLVIQRLTRSARLATFGATLWGICPLNEGSLGWYSVYGQVLTGTIQLWLLYEILGVAKTGQAPSRRRLAGWYLLLLAGATCFGVGIAVAMTCAAMAFLLLPASPARTRIVRVMSSLLIVIPVLFVSFHRLYAAISAGAVNEGMAQIGQLRAWRPILEMLGQLLRYGATSLALPYLSVGDNNGSALRNVVAVLWIAGMAVVLLRAPASHKRRLLAFLLSAVATYALIAAGRAAFYIALGRSVAAGATEPRYYYVGSISIAIVFCLLLDDLGRVARFGAWSRDALLVVWTGAIVFTLARRHPSIDHHATARKETQWVLATIDKLAKDTPEHQALYVQNYLFRSIDWDPTGNFPGWAAVFMIAYPDRVVHGRPVYFVETNPKVLAVARARPDRPINTILLSPDQVRALLRASH
jgi:hypothetical protein